MEGGPVNAAVVPLEHVLDDSVRRPEEVAVFVAAPAHAWGSVLLAQSGDIPDADGLIQRGRDDKVILGVKAGAHDIVVVARQHADASSRLPVPNADGLVVRGTDDPGVLLRAGVRQEGGGSGQRGKVKVRVGTTHLVEEGGANVVKMAEQGEDAPAGLVVPQLQQEYSRSHEPRAVADPRWHTLIL